MFSRQHYKAIAEIIAKQKSANAQDGTDTSEAINFVLFQLFADLADYFAQDNPHFNQEKFEKACGFYT